MKVSSVQVSPASQVSTGSLPCAACFGAKTAKRVSSPSVADGAA
jgi:hypothetical protein